MSKDELEKLAVKFGLEIYGRSEGLGQIQQRCVEFVSSPEVRRAILADGFAKVAEKLKRHNTIGHFIGQEVKAIMNAVLDGGEGN